MTDDYFTMGSSSSPWGPVDRGPLLEGVSDDLLEGANNALDGVATLRAAEFSLILGDEQGSYFEQMNQKVSSIFREFSAANLDRDSGLQSLIDRYERIWKTLQQDAKPKLDNALNRLEYWRGSAANAAKSYIGDLSEAFELVESKITVLEADVVAAREAIASARHDLNELGYSLKQVAEKYQEDKKRQAENARSKVLAAAFTGAVTGLLAAATMGVGAAAAGTVFTIARGAMFAANVAGSTIGEVISEEVSGDNAFDIFESFTDAVDKIRSGMEETSGDLAADIGKQAEDLPTIPPPPDVSPGASFDPSIFETDHTSRGTEKNVRDANVDIAPDGQVSSNDGDMSRLNG